MVARKFMLYKSEWLFQNIIEYIAEGIFVLNEAGEITFMNPEAERLLGWTAGELVHKMPTTLFIVTMSTVPLYRLSSARCAMSS